MAQLLSAVTPGTLVTLNESGSPVQFYVAAQNYESGLNGAGRTLLVRKDVYQKGQWNASGVNTYANSTIDQWFNGTYKALLDSWVQTAIGTTTFYYTPGNGDTNVTTLEKQVFPLSANELGVYGGLFNAEGSTVPIANLLRQNNGAQWTRTPYKSITTQSIYFDVDGGIEYGNCNSSYGYRPCFTLPGSITVLDDGTFVPLPISTLVISGTDGDLGTITNDIPYSVSTNTGNKVSLTRTVNGALVASLTVDGGFAYNIPVMDLPTGTGTIVITATVQTSSDPVTVTRTWTYTKAAVQFPVSGGVAQLSQDGQNVFPMTLAEAVRAIGGPWGGNLSTALDKLAKAAVYNQIGGKYRKFTVDLSAVQLGDIIQINENGKPVPFYVGALNYEQNLNGEGRILFVRKDVYGYKQWNSSAINTYANSTIDTFLNNTYKQILDKWVQAAIESTAFYYTPGNGNNSVTKLERSVFALSLTELGLSDSSANVEGSQLLIANQLKPVQLSGENENTSQFTRTPNINISNEVFMSTGDDGHLLSNGVTTNNGVRPCFTIPATFTYYLDEEGNVHTRQKYSHEYFSDLWGNVIPTVKIETGSYVGTGTHGSSNPNKLVFSGRPLLVFVYTATYFPTIITNSSSVNFIAGFQWAKGITEARAGAGIDNGTIHFEEDGKSLSWYHTTSEDSQANNSGTSYFYLAFLL